MKQVHFHYHLRITTDSAINNHRFTLRCTPVSDERQKILCAERYVSAWDYLSENVDEWGNVLCFGSCRSFHTGFEYNICGRAVLGLSDCSSSRFPARDSWFRYPTPLTAMSPELEDFSDSLDCDGTPIHQADILMEALAGRMQYTPGSTTVQTSAGEAFAAGRGVCQDYTHILLALLRSRGIPCRYAAGMLLGEGESHAWAEVLQDGCWYGFDPVNCIKVDDAHLKLSHGRDFRDCSINRGIFRGTAAQKTDISVIVTQE